MTKVLVTGASGFVAQHTIKLLLEKNYQVIGTVRSAAKGEQTKKDLGIGYDYEIVEDIGAPNAFDESLKKHPDVSVFIHTASPMSPMLADIENQIIKPAIDGTVNALNSVKSYGKNVKKMVITSTNMTMLNFATATDPNSEVITEESFNPIPYELGPSNPMLGYIVSKTFAEKAAWDFMKKENPHFTLNTIHPGMITGPQAFESGIKENMNFSSEFLNQIFKVGTDASKLQAIDTYFVDVRDVARIHLHAFESEVTNFRYLAVFGSFCIQDVLDIVNEKIPSLRGVIPVGTPGSGKDIANRIFPSDNSKTIALVGEGISLEQSVLDTINQIAKK